MQSLYGLIIKSYLRLIEPVAALLIRRGVSPNAITTFGTMCMLAGGVLYAAGHIMAAGWGIGLTALFDVLDGTVARRTGKSTVFGAFYDSTLDRIADGGRLSIAQHHPGRDRLGPLLGDLAEVQLVDGGVEGGDEGSPHDLGRILGVELVEDAGDLEADS